MDVIVKYREKTKQTKQLIKQISKLMFCVRKIKVSQTEYLLDAVTSMIDVMDELQSFMDSAPQVYTLEIITIPAKINVSDAVCYLYFLLCVI